MRAKCTSSHNSPQNPSPKSRKLKASTQRIDTKRVQDKKDTKLKQDLLNQLLRLNYPAFAHLMQALLERSGYSRVQVTGRLQPRGRIMHGGVDLTAYTQTDLETILTVAQLKQYRQLVGRRFVDELRGSMLRLSAGQGLLITTSRFSAAVRKLAAGTEVAPVRLIDGQELAELLIEHRIGIRERNGRWQTDKPFFKYLALAAPKAALQLQHELQSELESDLRHGASNLPARSQSESQLCPPTHIAIPEPMCGVKKHGVKHSAVRDPGVRNPGVKNHKQKEGDDMTWATHMMIGMDTLWLFEVLLPASAPVSISAPADIALLAAGTAFGALLPDLDAAQSKIKHLGINGIKPFYLPSQVLHRQLGHRGLLHSPLGLSLIALALLPLALWWGWAVPAAVLLGYASHLLADACTRSGVPLWYPGKRRFHLLPQPLRIVTGSQAEEVVFVLSALLVMLLLLRHVSAF